MRVRVNATRAGAAAWLAGCHQRLAFATPLVQACGRRQLIADSHGVAVMVRAVTGTGMRATAPVRAATCKAMPQYGGLGTCMLGCRRARRRAAMIWIAAERRLAEQRVIKQLMICRDALANGQAAIGGCGVQLYK